MSGYGGAICDTNTISNNKVYFLARTGIAITSGQTAKNNIVESNDVSYAMQWYGIPPQDGASLYTYNAGSGNIFRYNKVYNGGVGPYMCGGIMIDDYSGAAKVYDNIVYGHNGGGILLSGLGGVGGTQVYNNTCYNNDVGGWNKGEINLFRSVSNCIIKNNIFIATPGKYVLAASPGSGNVFDYNCYQFSSTNTPFYWNTTTYTTLASYKTATKQDTHSLNNDPKLVNVSSGDMHLQSISPCINAGTYLGLTRDYFGTTLALGSAVDMGADEF